jgi:hypothetical protein
MAQMSFGGCCRAGLGGNTSAMTMLVNGTGLMGRHLLNKPLVFAMRNDQELAWTSEDGFGYRVMYSPDFSEQTQIKPAVACAASRWAMAAWPASRSGLCASAGGPAARWALVASASRLRTLGRLRS